MLKGPKETIKKARNLRKAMSFPEVLLWRELRKRPNGAKFRRQDPAGAYVLDFYCSDARLAVEVDGEAHDRGNRPGRDAERDAWLNGNDVQVLRIAAKDVLHDLTGAIEHILAAVVSRLPLHQPAAGPPPRACLGEDFLEP